MRRLTIILLAIVLCLSVTLLAACGCEHYYENGACKYCGEVDTNYNPNNMGCFHYYQDGACKYCAQVDPNYQPPVCNHYFELGVCTHCGEADPNYVPVAPPTGDDKVATAIKVALLYGENGQEKSLTGVVYATAQGGYYINDGTASVFVQDATSVVLGDVVYVTGTLSVGALNQTKLVATQAEVVAQGATPIAPVEMTVADLSKMPAVATNYYQLVKLTGFVGNVEDLYTLSLEEHVVNVDANSNQLFQSIVGQKVVVTAVVSSFANTWVVTPVSSDAVEIVPADLDLVANEIFAWAQTQLPEKTFQNFELPTAYALEPTVEFAWSITGVSGVEVQNNGLVAINSVSGEVTIPLTLTLTCDGKTATYTYQVKVNADYVFEWAQGQLPAKLPLVYSLPTSYNNENNITFEWSVEQGNVIAIASNVVTVDAAAATQDITAKVRLTIKSGNNEMSKVLEVIIPAGGVSAFDDVASLPVGTTAKVVGTVLLKSYDHNKKDYSMAIVAENNDMYEVAFGTNTTEWAKYNAGDKVQITGQVREVWDSYTGKTIVRLTLSCDDVALVETAPSDYKIDISNMTVVTLATLEDYKNFVVNFDTKTGRTIVKIVNPYLVSSSTSGAGNYIRFGPDTTAASGYSNKVDGKTWKREFVFARNMLKEVCGTAFHDSLQVGATSKATPIQNTLEVYAVPMHLGDTTWQFVPISADFVTYTPAN